MAQSERSEPRDPDAELRHAEEMLRALEEGAAELRKTIQPNECPGCGSFNLDGGPPGIHKHECPWYEDGLAASIARVVSWGTGEAAKFSQTDMATPKEPPDG